MKFLKPAQCVKRYINDHALRVRVFRPCGLYPRGVLAAQGCLYYASEDLVFTVVASQPYDQHDASFPYSEMTWATPQELRFWTSIILCEDAEGPRVMFYPEHSAAGLIDAVDLDLQSPAIQEELQALVLTQIASSPNFIARPFSLFDKEINLSRQPEFLGAISEGDNVLLRGIACLIKCDMLSRHSEFVEEATIVSFIALDASFGLVLNLLQQSGIANPTARDAGKWLDDTFNKPVGILQESGKYFEAFYEQRILTMHPLSRYGSCPFAPLLVDDMFQLRRELREIFAFLVSGTHGPEFERRRATVAVW